jgi:hypothetical protein
MHAEASTAETIALLLIVQFDFFCCGIEEATKDTT